MLRQNIGSRFASDVVEWICFLRFYRIDLRRGLEENVRRYSLDHKLEQHVSGTRFMVPDFCTRDSWDGERSSSRARRRGSIKPTLRPFYIAQLTIRRFHQLRPGLRPGGSSERNGDVTPVDDKAHRLPPMVVRRQFSTLGFCGTK